MNDYDHLASADHVRWYKKSKRQQRGCKLVQQDRSIHPVSPAYISQSIHNYVYICRNNQRTTSPGLDVTQSHPTAQDVFQPIPGLISCTGVTGRWGLPYVSRTEYSQVAGLIQKLVEASSSKTPSLHTGAMISQYIGIARCI